MFCLVSVSLVGDIDCKYIVFFKLLYRCYCYCCYNRCCYTVAVVGVVVDNVVVVSVFVFVILMLLVFLICVTLVLGCGNLLVFVIAVVFPGSIIHTLAVVFLHR